MGTLFRFMFRLGMIWLMGFVLCAVIITMDGSFDQGQRADLGLVLGNDATPLSRDDPLLDRAVKEYNSGTFSHVLLVSPQGMEFDQPARMAQYLQSHGLPADALIQDRNGEDLAQLGRDVTGIMKRHGLFSVIVIADYYRISGVRVALVHEGMTQIGKAHVGEIRKEDVPEIALQTVAVFQYVARNYVAPTVEKVTKEAEAGLEKTKGAGENAKDKVDKGLESMPR